jgi:YgiT-type zinc finger domain-containing protein
MANTKGFIMSSINQSEVCPACGDPLVHQRVEKLLRGGVHTAVVKVDAEVCRHCGEQLFTTETVRILEEIRSKLARQDTADFVPVGQSFQVSTGENQPTS